MKSVLFSVVIISALVVAGIGGTLADFSDIEISPDNFFEVGSMNLLVSDEVGNVYDGPYEIPTIFEVFADGGAWPCCSKDIRFDLHLESQGQRQNAFAYLHIKNIECYGIEKVEPEIAVEDGGIIGELDDGTIVYSPPLGEYGENCELAEHIDIAMFTGPTVAGPWTPVDLSAYDANMDGIIKMNEIECLQLYLGELIACEPMWVMMTLHLQDVPEEYLGYDLFPGTDNKFNDWPTNALMKDGMRFDMSFELLQSPIP
jgi:hypothetical protein